MRPWALAEGECKVIRSVCWFERSAEKESALSLPFLRAPVGRAAYSICMLAERG